MAVPVRMQASVPGPTPGTFVETSYQELPPPAPLARAVTCTWIGAPGHPRELRVIPDGGVDVAWDGERFTVTRSVPQPLRVAVGGCRVLGVRLRAGLAGDILDTDVGALSAITELSELWSAAAVDRLHAAVTDVPLQAQPAALARALASAAPLRSGRNVALAAAERIEAGGGSVEAIADDLGISGRQLRRRFEAATGLNLATYRRIVRFQRFLRHADRAAGSGLGLSDLAATAGYSDQAHLSRECRALAGSSPARLLRLRGDRS